MQPTSEKCCYLEELSWKEISLKENWFCFNQNQNTGEEQALERPYSSLPVPEGAYKKAGEGLFTKACSDRTKGNGFKLKKGR